jgi:hypothetical protein
MWVLFCVNSMHPSIMHIICQTTRHHSPVLICIHRYFTTLWVSQTILNGAKIPWHYGQKCLILNVAWLWRHLVYCLNYVVWCLISCLFYGKNKWWPRVIEGTTMFLEAQTKIKKNYRTVDAWPRFETDTSGIRVKSVVSCVNLYGNRLIDQKFGLDMDWSPHRRVAIRVLELLKDLPGRRPICIAQVYTLAKCAVCSTRSTHDRCLSVINTNVIFVELITHCLLQSIQIHWPFSFKAKFTSCDQVTHNKNCSDRHISL